MDCFAALAMTGRARSSVMPGQNASVCARERSERRIHSFLCMDCFAALANDGEFTRHCEERTTSNPVFLCAARWIASLARNDDEVYTVIARSAATSNPFFLSRIASLRSQYGDAPLPSLPGQRERCARERSDEAIHSFLRQGLLRCARNDGEVTPSLRGAKRRSNPSFFGAARWIASLRSQWREGYTSLMRQTQRFAQGSARRSNPVFLWHGLLRRARMTEGTPSLPATNAKRCARERTTKQSSLSLPARWIASLRSNDGEHGLLREPVIGRAFARPGGSQRRRGLHRLFAKTGTTGANRPRQAGRDPCKSPAASPLRQVADRTMTVAVCNALESLPREPLMAPRTVR